MSESDGVDELVAGGMRVAITAAGLVAQRAAEQRTERARQAQAASAWRARRLEAQYNAELAAARGQLSLVERDGWWKAATVNDVADAWQTARTWRGVDPDVDRAADRIRTEVRDRYGVDIDVDVPAGIGSTTLQRAVSEREDADAARRRAREAGEQLEAAVVVAADSAAEQRAQDAAATTEEERGGAPDAPPAAVRRPEDLAHQVVAGLRAGAERDVAGRRTELTAALSEVSDREAVEARLLADVSDGRPAREAVTVPRRSVPKARKPRTSGPQVRQRGLGR